MRYSKVIIIKILSKVLKMFYLAFFQGHRFMKYQSLMLTFTVSDEGINFVRDIRESFI